ncbi:iron chelate uptake ABC transporter family permease subunit [Thalassovita sp.]|uniref:iron chelate uptake ABC transporter family permease subunit n=1 Tax=Thalassovita sp. TaxID=1979401 RepID=UPI002881C5CF|nr:iron chelate uptake ABC transporter family permease subunit [Thalassovita sp.]MDF1804568.1 iron chelate uptake ABC transporter family permease subunit [Thalassovita sp.]
MSILDSFLIRAALAGVGVALAAAPLGCFVVWRRMAYFGDATAHAAILGVALSLAFSTSVFLGALVAALVMALTVSALSGRGYAMDTLLGVLAHSALAFGLVAVSFLSGVRIDLMAYLFGDILAVSHTDLAVIWGGATLVLGLLWWRWSALLLSSLNQDLAYAAGVNPRREQLVLTVALALVVAVAIKVVGVLLIAALLIIPAATARPFASTPERMGIVAALLGSTSAIGGLALSYQYDTPTGPTIVCVTAVLFAVSSLGSVLRNRLNAAY